MDNRIEHNGISLRLNMDIEPIHISGRGWVHLVSVVSESSITREDMKKLSDLTLWGTKVSGIEYQAGYEVRKDIGLLFNRKLW